MKYSKTRSHSVPLDFFGSDYTGYVHCDGYAGYDAMAKVTNTILSGCMIHARRKFIDAAKVSKKSGLADYAVKIFSKLGKIEKEIKANTWSPEQVKKYRLEKSKPILDKFKIWLDLKSNEVPDKFLIGQAIGYTIRQWSKLTRYLDDGRLEWSNNFSERIMKMFATGRKNWMFSNSVDGANASAIIYSLVLTCRHHKIDVFEYFRQVLRRIPSCEKLEEFEALLPYNINL